MTLSLYLKRAIDSTSKLRLFSFVKGYTDAESSLSGLPVQKEGRCAVVVICVGRGCRTWQSTTASMRSLYGHIHAHTRTHARARRTHAHVQTHTSSMPACKRASNADIHAPMTMIVNSIIGQWIREGIALPCIRIRAKLGIMPVLVPAPCLPASLCALCAA
jgi:hypothetical protein